MLSLATGSFDSTMGIWRRREEAGVEKERSGNIRDDVEHSEREGFEVEIRRDGAARPMQGEDSDVEEDWEFAIVLEGHDSEVKNIAYSPSGQWLASCSRDKTIWIWEEIGEEGEDEFETIAVLQEHTADVKCVRWRKDDGNGEVLASASYDDTIRFWKDDGDGEWSCFAVLEGHEGTVWSLDWEPEVSMRMFDPPTASTTEETDHSPRIPRLTSSSADNTIRIWTKELSVPPPNRPSYINSGIPSTMRPGPTNETWKCTAILPAAHSLPIYSVNWSQTTGRVVSTGGDGKVVIYEERTKGRAAVGGEIEREWVILGVLEGGHGPYEINHATWCTRFDPGKREAGEEMVVTTGDDGVVRAWVIHEAK